MVFCCVSKYSKHLENNFKALLVCVDVFTPLLLKMRVDPCKLTLPQDETVGRLSVSESKDSIGEIYILIS